MEAVMTEPWLLSRVTGLFKFDGARHGLSLRAKRL
jgi:hypothetical protein